MSVWHPGYGLTYGQYLQAESFISDLTGAVKESGHGIETKISRQTKELVANNEQLVSEFGKGFDSVNETLNWGFQAIERGFGELSTSIDELSATFNYNLGILIHKVSVTNKLLSNLINKLDAIHRTLESPTLTQAREFYNIGCDRLSKGLLDKALEAFLAAENKNDTDFFTQFNIGKLYLYGIDEDDNVLDLEKAKKHLLSAARYAKAEKNVDSSFTKLAAEALFHASIAVYAQLGEKNILGDNSKTSGLLEEAKRLVLDAITLQPRFSEASYHLAKYTALLGESEISVNNLQTAIDVDRSYAVKVDVDRAFDSVRSQVTALLSKMRDAKKNECQSKLNNVNQVLLEMKEWHLEKSIVEQTDNYTLDYQFTQCEYDYTRAQKLFKADTYFGFLDALSLLDSVNSRLSVLKSRRESELSNVISKLLAAARATLPKKGEHSKNIEDLIEKAEMLIKKAESQLKQRNYESYISAISIAKSACNTADSAEKRASQEDDEVKRDTKARLERARLKERKNEASWKYMKYGAGVGLVFGFGISMLIASALNPNGTNFGGLFGFWFIFILLFAGIGYLIGQMGMSNDD